MATITGLTAERMIAIEGATVISGVIVDNHLILTKYDGTTVDAGALPPGPQGPAGPAGGMIPGEIKLWPGTTLPAEADYGKWVWADGAIYVVATYPEAAANIASAWRTFGGVSDPGGSNFRVPDLRGLVPAGMDQMPGGARANRMTRAVAITIAGRTGEETHVITIPEMPAHGHTVNDPGHSHANSKARSTTDAQGGAGGVIPFNTNDQPTTGAYTGITIANNGGGGAHENVQPTVFIPYIVKLDD